MRAAPFIDLALAGLEYNANTFPDVVGLGAVFNDTSYVCRLKAGSAQNSLPCTNPISESSSIESAGASMPAVTAREENTGVFVCTVTGKLLGHLYQ
jgi:hypothetical protein